jgi:predicted small secreted protein
VNVRTVLMVVAVLVAATVVLAGCGGVGVDVYGNYKYSVIHENVNGRDVACIVARTSHGAGISCDWGH